MADSHPTRGRSRRPLRLLMFAGTAIVLTGFVLAADVLEDSKLDTVDARLAIRGDLEPPADIVIVGIGEESFTDWASSGRSRTRSAPRRSHV